MKEETIMTSLFGNHPKVKLLELLIIGKGLGYSISDIAEHAEIGRSSVYRLLDGLIKDELIVETKRYGRIRLFSINEKNEIIQEMMIFLKAAVKIASDREVERQMMKVKTRH